MQKHILNVLDDEKILEVADLLDLLEQKDSMAADVARARLFRYSIPEIARLMDCEPKKIEAKWTFARASMRTEVAPA